MDYLSQVHASLNDIDKLRRLISKIQKEYNPYGQGILGLTYNIWKGKEEYEDYVQQAGMYLKLYYYSIIIILNYYNILKKFL